MKGLNLSAGEKGEHMCKLTEKLSLNTWFLIGKADLAGPQKILCLVLGILLFRHDTEN